jgi:hypothetical protein
VIPDGAPFLNGEGIKAFVTARWVEASRVEVANGTTARARKIAQYRELAELFLKEVENQVFVTDKVALAAKRAEQKAAQPDEDDVPAVEPAQTASSAAKPRARGQKVAFAVGQSK